LIKIIKERIRKKEKFPKIKNVRSRNYLEIIEALDKKIYIKKNRDENKKHYNKERSCDD